MSSSATIPSLLDATQHRPMSREETEILLLTQFAVMARPAENVVTDASGAELGQAFRAAWPEGEIPFEVKVFCRRVATLAPDARFDPDVIPILMSWALNAGEAVQYAHAATRYYRLRGQPLTVKLVCEEVWPSGPPTREEIIRLWKAQKQTGSSSRTDNQLDYPEAYQ